MKSAYGIKGFRRIGVAIGKRQRRERMRVEARRIGQRVFSERFGVYPVLAQPAHDLTW